MKASSYLSNKTAGLEEELNCAAKKIIIIKVLGVCFYFFNETQDMQCWCLSYESLET